MQSGGEPRQGDGLSAAGFHGVYLPHVLAVVLCIRVVCFMHGDGIGIVVYGDIHAAADGYFYTCGRSAAAGEVIDE